MRSRLKNDNKGFSLIELIVVVLIMGIMSGGAIIAMSTVMSARVSSATSMTTNLLKQARQKALSMKNEETPSGLLKTTDIYVEFYRKDKDIYGSVKQHTSTGEVDLLTEKICNDYVDIMFSDHYNGDKWKIGTIADGGTTVKIYFKKNTGGIASIKRTTPIGDEIISADTIVVDKPSSDDDKDTRTIIIVKGTGRTYEEK